MKLDLCPLIATFQIALSRRLPPSNRVLDVRMPLRFADIVEEARLSARALLEYGDHFFHPTVRLGVTGLSRAGKTVFITALIHGLTRGGRFPIRSEEHTSELQSHLNLVCRLLLEKKKHKLTSSYQTQLLCVNHI